MASLFFVVSFLSLFLIDNRFLDFKKVMGRPKIGNSGN